MLGIRYVQIHLIVTLGAALFAQGCGDEGGDDAQGEVCCDCYEVGDPCPPEAEDLVCEDTMPWCGGQTASGGATWRCYQGVWGEVPSGGGAPSPNPAGCVAVHGEGWTCNDNGECVEETGDEDVCCECYQEGDPCPPEAEALSCPGSMMWCDGWIPWGGMGCEEGVWRGWIMATGFPSPDSDSCQDANGPESYCAEDGSCVEGAPCQGSECCLPASEVGDDQCQSSIGTCSWCQYSDDNWGHCQPLTCD